MTLALTAEIIQHQTSRVSKMSKVDTNVKFCNDGNVSAGDVIIDRRGNEMVVVEVLDGQAGDCWALFNGQVRLINAFRVAKVMETEIEGKATRGR